MRVLFVEDSPRLRTYVGKALRRAGYALDLAADGEDGLWMAESHRYDVIVLDIMLPKLDGLSILDRLRGGGNQTHVLLLTAKDAVEDRVTGLRMGADDYLIKPFAMEELLARVETLARRGYEVKSRVVRAGGLELDLSARTASRNGNPLDLAPREYALLELLVLRRGQVVSRTEIEEHIYDERAEPMSNVVDSAVCLLRRKIDASGAPSLIRTRRGEGYTFEGSSS